MGGENNPEKFQNHVVICNCNEKVKTIIEELQAGTIQEPLDVILIIQDEGLWEKNPQWHPIPCDSAMFLTISGSPFDKECLKKARIEKAKSAVILADPNQGSLADGHSTLTAIAIEQQNPQVHTVQELILSINREHLKAMNVDEVVCLGEISEKLIAQSCITPGVKNIFETLLTTGKGTPQIILPKLSDNFAGKTFREISRKCIENDAPFILIGFIVNCPEIIEKKGENTIMKSYLLNPRKNGKDLPLKEGDQLIMITYKQPPPLESFFEN